MKATVIREFALFIFYSLSFLIVTVLIIALFWGLKQLPLFSR
jgi:hypothetical protein